MNGHLTTPSWFKRRICYLICLLVPVLQCVNSFGNEFKQWDHDVVNSDENLINQRYNSDEYIFGNKFKQWAHEIINSGGNLIGQAHDSEVDNYLNTNFPVDPDANRNLTELITSNHYPVEVHTVQTEDGFLLDLHRIPHGRASHRNPNRRRPPVFLQHGLLSSGCDWVMNFANDSLGFILADRGFDVWIGNSRGNTYSRRHVTYTPDQDEFWDWSFDELAKYDLPANINYILEKTNEHKLFYVGHSQGTIIAYAAFSHFPELKQKIQLYIGLAPIISLDHMISPLKYLSLLSDNEAYFLFGHKDFLPSSSMTKQMAQKYCTNKYIEKIACSNFLFMMAGPDSKFLNASRLPVYMSHTPAGTSVKNMIHYAQWYRSKTFAQYDYGSESKNRQHYGTNKPPVYLETSVDVPSVLFTAGKDWLADPTDVKTLLNTVKNVQHRYDYPTWNHLDFTWAENAGDTCYKTILKQFLNTDFRM